MGGLVWRYPGVFGKNRNAYREFWLFNSAKSWVSTSIYAMSRGGFALEVNAALAVDFLSPSRNTGRRRHGARKWSSELQSDDTVANAVASKGLALRTPCRSTSRLPAIGFVAGAGRAGQSAAVGRIRSFEQALFYYGRPARHQGCSKIKAAMLLH